MKLPPDVRWTASPELPLAWEAPVLVAEQLLGGTAGPQIRSSDREWEAVDFLHVGEASQALKLAKTYLQEFPKKKFLFLTAPNFPASEIPAWFGKGALATREQGELVARAIGTRRSDDSRLLLHARKLTPKYDLSQLVLPPKAQLRLGEAIDYITTKKFCENDWGFRETHSRGHGVTLLFHGPSGTGKTMAAEVVANTLQLPLYQIDLSSVFSKWVGETEKNLKAIFRAAEGVEGILLFDEGDAIFGQRTQVKDSQDRYGNLEVNYLLQEIETFDGIAILSTNHETNLDPAFLRRFTYTVTFGPPPVAQRESIWRANIPKRMPVGEVNFGHLARFPLTGGNIRNCVRLAAARAATQERTQVEHLDLLWAIKRELQKHGEEIERSMVGEEYWRRVAPDWEFLAARGGK